MFFSSFFLWKRRGQTTFLGFEALGGRSAKGRGEKNADPPPPPCLGLTSPLKGAKGHRCFYKIVQALLWDTMHKIYRDTDIYTLWFRIQIELSHNIRHEWNTEVVEMLLLYKAAATWHVYYEVFISIIIIWQRQLFHIVKYLEHSNAKYKWLSTNRRSQALSIRPLPRLCDLSALQISDRVYRWHIVS